MKIKKALRGKFEKVFRAEEDAVEESLVSGVRGVPTDDVDNRFWQANGFAGGFALEGFFQNLAGERPGEGLELSCGS